MVSPWDLKMHGSGISRVHYPRIGLGTPSSVAKLQGDTYDEFMVRRCTWTMKFEGIIFPRDHTWPSLLKSSWNRVKLFFDQLWFNPRKEKVPLGLIMMRSKIDLDQESLFRSHEQLKGEWNNKGCPFGTSNPILVKWILYGSSILWLINVYSDHYYHYRIVRREL